MSIFRKRQPAGVPAGGQFAATTQSEPTITLSNRRPEGNSSGREPGTRIPYHVPEGSSFAGGLPSMSRPLPATDAEIFPDKAPPAEKEHRDPSTGHNETGMVWVPCNRCAGTGKSMMRGPAYNDMCYVCLGTKGAMQPATPRRK